jgi:phosphatidylserine/phosphatidylglycerophosphate/cardiolipin synthase-like enzyme
MDEQRLLDHWLAPEGAGQPMAVVATSFTFDTDFFRDNCLARFLGMRVALGEGSTSSLVQLNELEECLAQVTATAIIDRSAGVEARNLRWDVLPVVHKGGLLHAKTAMLMWENSIRIIIGSANLTPAGYRRQQEIAVAFELESNGQVPRNFWDDYAEELRRILLLVPDEVTATGPKSRALAAVDLLEQRIREVAPPARTDARVTLAPSRPGQSALDVLRDSWVGPKARRLKAMSPYWDREDAGKSDAVRALTGLLAATGEASAHLAVPIRVSDAGQLTNAPDGLPKRACRQGLTIELDGVSDYPGNEFRRLHAKALLVESDEWVSLMIGSSNMTSAGLGLNPAAGNIELNVIFGAPRSSALGKALQEVLPESKLIDTDAIRFGPLDDEQEDEPSGAVLPAAFLSAVLSRCGEYWELLMKVDPPELPQWWEAKTTDNKLSVASSDSSISGDVVRYQVANGEALPLGLIVKWTDPKGHEQHADWIINVAEPADLPLDDRLRAIPIDLIIQALSLRGVGPSITFERLLESWDANERPSTANLLLDPLRAYDDSRALLREMSTYGRALDTLCRQLSRPCPTAAALSWRLTGVISPARLTEGWVKQHADGKLSLELAHFLLAEIQVTLHRVDWAAAVQGLDEIAVAKAKSVMQSRWQAAYDRLPPLLPGSELHEYVRESVALHAS